MVKIGSLFDGIGGWQIAAIRAGAKPVWSSEIERFPMAVTKIRFPETVQLGDVRKIVPEEMEPVDILCAGSPCQDLSVAGRMRGLAGVRSGLFVYATEFIHRMRAATGGKYPRFFIWENVPGAFISNSGADFGAVLEKIGKTKIPIPKKWAYAGMAECELCEIAWRTLDAQHFGVPQRRRRIFLVADFAKSERCAGKILFERKSVQGIAGPGEAAQEGFAGSVEKSTGAAGVVETYDVRISSYGTKNFRAHCYKTDKCRALDTHAPDPTTNHGGPVIILNDQVIREYAGLSPTLNAGMGTGGNQVPVYCIAGNTIDRKVENGGNGSGVQSNVSYTLNTVDRHAVMHNKTLRRLTPLECERLQGLPDNYTLIDEKSCSDSARYKALGNGMAQPVADWVMKRTVDEVKDDA